MNREDLKAISKKRILVYGSEKQKRDLEFMFTLENVIGNVEKATEIHENVESFDVLIICSGKDISFENESFSIIQDYELIELLKFPFEDIKKDRKIAIWGTGYFSNIFSEHLLKGDNFKYIDSYIDNNPQNTNKEKNGLKIISSEKISPKEYFVIIATGLEFFKEIKEQIIGLNYKNDDYIYYENIINDATNMFLKTYNEKRYIDSVCKNLDHAVRISKTGNMSICCMAYEGIYGNLFTEDFYEIWNSLKAKVCRLSLMNHSFSFCATDRCPFLSGSDYLENGKYDKKYDFPYEDFPRSVAPEVDYSCNLCCPSCRKEVFFENGADREEYAKMVVDKLANIPSRLIINTVGEIFASKNCKYILDSKELKKRDQLSIYTNGTLITESILKDLTDTYKDLEFAVSIDAATEETYKKLRVGGNFNNLMNAMNLLSGLRKEGKISYLQVNYVVQSENVSEIASFVKLAKSWNVDRIAMNGLENWGSFTEEEYEEKSIWRNGKIKEEYLVYFSKELVEDETINFFNISNYIGAKPKEMYMV